MERSDSCRRKKSRCIAAYFAEILEVGKLILTSRTVGLLNDKIVAAASIYLPATFVFPGS